MTMREYEYRAQHTAQSTTQPSKHARKQANKHKLVLYVFIETETKKNQKLCSFLTETTHIPVQTVGSFLVFINI